MVTGAAQGIGAAIATRLARDGWHVWCVDVSDDVDSTAKTILAASGSASVAQCELDDANDVRALWQTVAEADGPVSGLVNNAGIFPRSPADEITLEEWGHVLGVNLTGTFLMCQSFARQARIGGAIVNTGSGQAFRPTPLGAHYAASKAGVVNLGRALAAEWGSRGIRVNTVIPGLVDTAQSRLALGDDQFNEHAELNPMGRLATPDDVSAAVAMMLSPDAGFINGQVLAVNGGAIML